MANPVTILIDQVTLGAGTPGSSRVDGVTGQVVTLSDPANPGAVPGRLWTLLVPDGSTVVLSSTTAELPTFTPAVGEEGAYLAFVEYGDGTKSYTLDADGNKVSTQGGLAIAQPGGNQLLGLGETLQFDGVAGYGPRLDALLRPLDAQLPSADENDALAGTDGAPAAGNPYVTDSDSRNTDARTPTAHTHAHTDTTGKTTDDHHAKLHAADHGEGQPDAVKLDDLAVPDDNTDLDASTSVHGLMQKYPGGTTDFLRADGSFAVPPSGGTTAEALATTGADVDVAAAAPPSVGQVLKATAATTATWQDESGSAEPVTAALGDYLSKLGSSQTGIVVGDSANLDTVDRQRGDLSSSGNQFVGLKAGRTYLLIGRMRSSTDNMGVRWYDVTNSVWLGQAATATTWRAANTHEIFTPLVDTTVELRINWIQSSPANSDGSDSWGAVIEIGAVQANVIGGLEYMDQIVVGASAASVTFGATGDGALLRALDGDADEQYVVVGRIVKPGNTANDITLQPNAITANQMSVRRNLTSAGLFQGTNATLLISDATAQFGYFKASLDAKTGQPRHWLSDSINTEPGVATTDLKDHHCGGKWDDTSTNITSLVVAIAGTTFEPGSVFTLYRVTTNNVRADSASTYERNVEATVAQGTNAEVEYTTGHATFQGSAIGVSASLNDVVTAGSITVNLKVGGVTVLTATLDTTNTIFDRDIESVGVHDLVAGDEIEIGIATTSLVTTGAGTPGITVNVTLVNEGISQPPETAFDYLYAGLSEDQTVNKSVNHHIEWNVEDSRGTSITLTAPDAVPSQNNGLFTLEGGKRYELYAHLNPLVNEGGCHVQWRDDSDDSALVDVLGLEMGGFLLYDNVGTDNVTLCTSTHIFEPVADITIKLDVITTGGLQRFYYLRSRVWIKEIL